MLSHLLHASNETARWVDRHDGSGGVYPGRDSRGKVVKRKHGRKHKNGVHKANRATKKRFHQSNSKHRRCNQSHRRYNTNNNSVHDESYCPSQCSLGATVPHSREYHESYKVHPKQPPYQQLRAAYPPQPPRMNPSPTFSTRSFPITQPHHVDYSPQPANHVFGGRHPVSKLSPSSPPYHPVSAKYSSSSLDTNTTTRIPPKTQASLSSPTHRPVVSPQTIQQLRLELEKTKLKRVFHKMMDHNKKLNGIVEYDPSRPEYDACPANRIYDPSRPGYDEV